MTRTALYAALTAATLPIKAALIASFFYIIGGGWLLWPAPLEAAVRLVGGAL